MAESATDRLRSIPGVDEVLGIAAKEQLIAGQAALPGRSRAFLKVQDGCDNRCSFCLVGTLRGRPESRPADQVLREASQLVDQGFQELVLVGLNLGRYGADCGSSLTELLKQLAGLDRTFRLRLSSIEPETIGSELAEEIGRLCRASRLCPHFHIPLQSGNDRLLKAMNRRGTVAQYEDLILRMAAETPDANIGTDLIAGFPQEDETAFEDTLAIVRRLPFGYLHAFSYSPRPGTGASTLADSVPRMMKKTRVSQLRSEGSAKSLAYRLRFTGSLRSAVLLGPSAGNDPSWFALTDNYIRVRIPQVTPTCTGLPSAGRTGADEEDMFRPGTLTRIRIDQAAADETIASFA
jgi:threonylcarbamoyladenosine tRNA methylthiotransferase MtaB